MLFGWGYRFDFVCVVVGLVVGWVVLLLVGLGSLWLLVVVILLVGFVLVWAVVWWCFAFSFCLMLVKLCLWVMVVIGCSLWITCAFI